MPLGIFVVYEFRFIPFRKVVLFTEFKTNVSPDVRTYLLSTNFLLHPKPMNNRAIVEIRIIKLRIQLNYLDLETLLN